MVNAIKIGIFGAGPVGMTAALCLHKLGHQVTIYEKRESYDKETFSDKRSINLTLSERGMKVLRFLGLQNLIIEHSVGINGREVHRTQKKSFIQYYGDKTKAHLFSITRKDLINVIYAEANSQKGIRFEFGKTLLRILPDDHTCLIQDKNGDTDFDVFDMVIGADGVNSVVQDHVRQRRQGRLESSYFDWGYRSFTLSIADAIKIQLEKSRVHIFGSKQMMIFVFANRDGSFSGNAFTPFENESSVNNCGSIEDLTQLILRQFPDLGPVASAMAEQLFRNQTANVQYSVTNKCQTSGSVLLLGDSFRSVYHFYAQGVNAGLEDCLLITEIFKRKCTVKESLIEFESLRVPMSNSLVNLSRNNFYFLQSKASKYSTQSRNKIESLLTLIFPTLWPSGYQLVCNGDVDYSQAEKTIRTRNFIWHLLLLWIPQAFLSAGLYLRDQVLKLTSTCSSMPTWALTRRLSFLVAAALMSILSLDLIVSAAHSAEVKVALATNLTEADKTLWNPSRAYIRKAAELAVADLGPELKKRDIQIRLVPFDIGNNVAKAVEASKAITQSDSLAIIGFPKSSDALIVAGSFIKAKLAFVTPSGSAERLAENGGAVKSGGPSTGMQARALISAVVSRNMSRMGMITVADCAYCQSLRTAIKSELEKRSLKLVFDEVVLSDISHYKESFSKLKSSPTDVIFLPNYEFESSSIIGALAEAEVSTSIYVGCTAWADMSTLLSHSLEKRNTKSIILALWDKKMTAPYAVRFEKRFYKMFKEPPHDVAALSYNATLIVLRAILNARSLDRIGIAQSLLDLTEVELLTGPASFKQNKTFSTGSMNVLVFKGSHMSSAKMVPML